MPLNGLPPCLPRRSFSEGWCSHVPNRGEQMARYYGYYSNLCRGKREKQNNDDDIPSIAVNTKSASLNKFQYLQSLDYDK